MLMLNPRFQMEIPNEEPCRCVGELVRYAGNNPSLSDGVITWQAQHFLAWVSCESFALNSHPEVLSVLKHRQSEGKKRRKKGGSRRWCHVPLERSIFTATQASSSALLDWKHPALSFRPGRQKTRDSVFQQANRGEMDLFKTLPPTEQELQSACVLYRREEQRDGSMKWRNFQPNTSAPGRPSVAGLQEEWACFGCGKKNATLGDRSSN